MIKCNEIKPSSNPKIVIVGFEQVLDEFAMARGFANPKKAWIPAAITNTFVVGVTYAKEIIAVMHDVPQYEGHKPFEVNGKYYTMKIV